jgi:replicative DNA helicase
MTPQENIKKLIINHSLRLQKLREQQALEGFSTDPRVLLEIESIEVNIKKLQTELTEIESKAEPKIEIIPSNSKKERKETNIPTPLEDLNRLLGGGFQRGDLIVIVSRPRMGKSSLAKDFLVYAASNGENCLLFSLDKTDTQQIHRITASSSGIPVDRIRRGYLENEESEQLIKALAHISTLPILIDDTPGITIKQIRKQSIRYHQEQNIDLIVIDYLQLISDNESEQDDKRQPLDKIKILKNLGRELNVPVILVSQLGRALEQRFDKRPILSDLDDAIEAHADVVVFIYRDEVYNPDTEFPNIAEIIVSKNRDGYTGEFSVYFKKQLGMFLNLEVKIMPLE